MAPSELDGQVTGEGVGRFDNDGVPAIAGDAVGQKRRRIERLQKCVTSLGF